MDKIYIEILKFLLYFLILFYLQFKNPNTIIIVCLNILEEENLLH